MRLLLRLLLLFLSAAGFLVQVSQVASQYLAYKTTSDVKFEEEQQQPAIIATVCFKTDDIINWNSADSKSAMANMTLSNIFAATPAAEDALKLVQYRDEDGNVRFAVNKVDVQAAVSVSRFYSQGRVCYMTRTRFNYSFPADVVQLADDFTFALYRLVFSEAFMNASSVQIVLNTAQYPHASRRFASLKHLEGRARSWSTFSSFEQVILLPPPWDTKCIKVNYPVFFAKRRQCMMTGMMQWNGSKGGDERSDKLQLLPPFEILEEGLTGRLMLATDDHFASFSRKLFHRCWTSSPVIPCRQFHSVTHTHAQKSTDESLELTVQTSKQPSRVTRFSPLMSFVDFFSFLCSCFGTWFGVSFLSLQVPLKRLQLWNQRRCLSKLGTVHLKRVTKGLQVRSA